MKELMRDLIKQPNGKYCSVNMWGELEFFNLTEEEIINMYIEKAKANIVRAYNFGELIRQMENADNFNRQTISDEQLKDMGYDKSFKELVKFIPRKPRDTRYVVCDFATYGKCPTCGEKVVDGMGYKDTKCKCGQLLKW